jgi:ABC-2 type transport system ATP-binding protein
MNTALSIKNLQKTYSNGFHALKGIDLEIEQGDFFALLGPNGAGKSTTIGVIADLVTRTSGDVHVFGVNSATAVNEAKRHIGLVPQEFNFNGFEKIKHILITQAGYYGIPSAQAEPHADRLLKQLGLWEKRDNIARTLSGGMKRRLMIARALVHQPQLLILDEPTAGVDIELRRSMWEFLQQLNADGTTIILTTHYLEEAESLCRNIAIIDQGKIIENTDMKSLLSRLGHQTFILYLAEPIDGCPQIDAPCELIDHTTLEVSLKSSEHLTPLFTELSKQGITVASMKNKANRLEELFLTLVEPTVHGANS